MSGKPELSGAARDAEIDRLSRVYEEDGALSREVRDAADLATERRPGVRKGVLSAFLRPAFDTPDTPDRCTTCYRANHRPGTYQGHPFAAAAARQPRSTRRSR